MLTSTQCSFPGQTLSIRHGSRAGRAAWVVARVGRMKAEGIRFLNTLVFNPFAVEASREVLRRELMVTVRWSTRSEAARI